MSRHNKGIELFKKSAYLYRSIKVLSFCNKLHRLNTVEKIVYLMVLSGGIYLLLNRVFGRIISASGSGMDDTVLAIFIYIFILLRLLFAGKFSLQREDVSLLQLFNSTLNPLTGYRFMAAATKVFFPLILSLYIGVVQNSPMNGVVTFLFLFLFVNIANGAGFFLQFCKLSLKPYIVRAINGVLLIGVLVLFLAYMNNLPISSAMALPVAPISAIVSSLMYGDTLVINHLGGYLFFYILLYLLLVILFYRWLSSKEFRLSLESEKELVKPKEHVSGKRFTVLEHQLIIVKMAIADKSKILSLMLPSIIYILLSIYSFSAAIEKREEVSSINFIVAQWLALIGFPVIYTLSNFKHDLQFIWIYRYSPKATRMFFIGSILKYYLSNVLSLIISFVFINLCLLSVYNTDFFEFMNIPVWALLTFIMPILFSLIGLLIALKLPEAYFNANGYLSIVPMIALIWFIGLATSPILIALITGYNLISLLFLIILSVILFFACKHIILKIEI